MAPEGGHSQGFGLSPQTLGLRELGRELLTQIFSKDWLV